MLNSSVVPISQGIQAKHYEYNKIAPRWAEIDKIIRGDASELIKPIEVADIDRTQRYRDDAILANFSNRTLQGLLGGVFRRPADVELPPDLEYLLDDATPEGWKLEQLAKYVVSETIKNGRVGLLIDYPQKDGKYTTAADVLAEGIHARICKYDAASIDNWSTARINGQIHITMVKLKELCPRLGADGFTWTVGYCYRVLTLEDGKYIQRVYEDDGKLREETQPLKGDGTPWTTIPFVIVGSENNDMDIDIPPLGDLVRLNIGHYRNSADVEEMSRLIGQPTLVINTDYSTEQMAQEMGGRPVLVGSRQALFLGTAGKAMYVQPTEANIQDKLMQRKEEQAVMLGARLIMHSKGVETAEAARIRNGSENSILTTIVQNVSMAILAAIKLCAVFENIGDDVEVNYQLNEQFFDDKLDAQTLMASIQLFDRQIVSTETMYDAAQCAGIADPDKSFEDEQKDIAKESPLASNMPPMNPLDAGATKAGGKG